jgi:hypothetical protein
MLPAQARQQEFDRPPPWFADNVANEKDLHRLNLMERTGRARKSGLEPGYFIAGLIFSKAERE